MELYVHDTLYTMQQKIHDHTMNNSQLGIVMANEANVEGLAQAKSSFFHTDKATLDEVFTERRSIIL